MAIELPELLQRVIIDTKSMRDAERRARELEGTFDDLTDSLDSNIESTQDNTEARDENTEATERGRDATSGAAGSMGDHTRSTDANTGATRRNTEEIRRNSEESRRNRGDHLNAGRARDKEGSSWADLSHKLISATQGMELVGAAMSVLKIPAMAGAIPFAVQGIAALGAGATALVGQLAPLSGLVAALPAGFLALKSTSFAFKSITSDAMSAADAVEQFGANSKQAQDAMKGLPKEGKNFALGMVDFKGAVKQMQASMQKIALPAFTRTLGTITKSYLPIFRRGMEGVSRALRDSANEMNEFLKTTDAQKDFGKIMDINAKVVGTLSKALKPLTRALMDVMVEAGPMVEGLAEDINKLANAFSDWIRKSRESGKLTEWFGKTLSVVRQLGRTFWDVVVGLTNIVRVGTDVMTTGKGAVDFLGNLEKGAESFRKWTESGKGIAKITKVFENAKPILHELWLLIKDVAIGFGLMAEGSQQVDLAGLIRTFRTDLLPLMFQFINAATELIPPIVNLAETFLGFFNALPFTPMATLVNILAEIGKALTWVVQTVPGASWAIAFFLLYRSAKKYLSIASKLPGIGKLIQRVPGMKGKKPPCLPIPQPCDDKTGAAGGAGKKIMDKMKKLGESMKRGASYIVTQIGRIGSAFVSLGGIVGRGIGTAATKTFQTIALNARGMSLIVGSAFSKVGSAISTAMSKGGGQAASGASKISGALSNMVSTVGTQMSKFKSAVATGVNTAFTGIGTAMGTFKTKVATGISEAAAAVGPKMTALRTTISNALSGAVTATTSRFTTIRDTILTKLGEAIPKAQSKLDQLKTAITDKLKGIASSGGGAFDTLKTKLTEKLAGLQTAAGTQLTKLRNTISTKLTAINAMARTKMTALQASLSTGWGRATSAASTQMTRLSSVISTGFTRAGGAARTGMTSVTGVFARGFGALGTMLTRAATGIRVFSIALMTGLRTAVMAVIGPIWAFTAALLANPITWIVIAIVALVAAFVWLWMNVEGFRNFFIGVWDAIKSAVGAAWDFIVAFARGIWDAIRRYVGFVINFWKTVFKTIWLVVRTYLTLVLNFYRTIFTTIWNVVSTVFGAVLRFVTSVVQGIWNVIRSIFGTIASFLGSVWGGITSIVGNAIKWVGDRIRDGLSFISGLWSGVWNGFATVVTNVWNGIKGAIQRAWDWIRARISDIGDAISRIPVVGGLIGRFIGRAIGGPVQKGQPYVVGEKGPELFVPWTGGRIVPNQQLKGAIQAMPTTSPGGRAGEPAGAVSKQVVNNYTINIYETTGPTSEESILRTMRRVSMGAA